MPIVHPKEPSELAKKTFSGVVVMNLYPIVSEETRKRILERQRQARQEAELKAKQEAEQKVSN